MRDPADTTPEMLMRAADIGRRAGLRYVYGATCRDGLVISRIRAARRAASGWSSGLGHLIRDYRVTLSGSCPSCGTPVPSLWGSGFDGQITSRPFVPGIRRFRTL